MKHVALEAEAFTYGLYIQVILYDNHWRKSINKRSYDKAFDKVVTKS